MGSESIGGIIIMAGSTIKGVAVSGSRNIEGELELGG